MSLTSSFMLFSVNFDACENIFDRGEGKQVVMLEGFLGFLAMETRRKTQATLNEAYFNFY